jgi:FkbM family methyltransferase
MQFLKTIIAPFPRAKMLAKSIIARAQGLPPITFADITKERIREYVGKDNPVILEIGCNDGTHTLWFLEAFRAPHVYCFEPDPRAITRFKAKVGQRKEVQLFEIALSDRDGEITFYQSSGKPEEEFAGTSANDIDSWDQSGSIRPPKEHLEAFPWVTFDQNITVPTTTLDAWCEAHGIEAIDFIWMDVQGAEIDVFRGGAKALANTRFLYTEYSTRQLYNGQFTLKQLLGYLQNFELLVRYQSDILLKNKHIR